jgi:FtsZ-binding cell division protein ZapB
VALGINVHYEILGRRGSSWTILEVINDRENATDKASQLWSTKRYNGVRVIKETYNKHENEFQSVEIFARGSGAKKSKYDQSGEVTPCLTPDDLYGPDGRRSIWELLGNTLAEWRITPTELLHNLEHYYKLFNMGTTLQQAVQRTAVSFEQEQSSIQERMRKIYKVIDASVDIMKRTKDSVPSLEMGRLKPITEALEEKSNKRFLLTASLSEYLRPAVTMSDKFGRIAVFLTHSRPDWVIEILDQLIAEFLLNSSVLDALLGEKDDRRAFITEIAYLQTGQLGTLADGDWEFDFNDDALRISGFLADGHLPQTTHVLFDRLKKEIVSSQPIAEGGLVTQLEVLTELKEICQNLQQDIHALDAINDDLDTRAGRLINSQSVGDLLAACNTPIEQIHALLDLEAVTVGMSNKRLVANFIMPILSRPENEAIFMGLDHQPIVRMNELVALQKKVMKAELTEMHRRKIAEKLDSFCRTILDNTQILKKLHKLDIRLQDKAIKILNMMADSYFTDGECRDAAEHQVRVYMKQDGFTSGLIEGQDRTEAEKTLTDFRDLLARAGIDRTDANA